MQVKPDRPRRKVPRRTGQVGVAHALQAGGDPLAAA